MQRSLDVLKGGWNYREEQMGAQSSKEVENGKGSVSMSAFRPTESASWQSWQLGFYSSTGWEVENLLFLMITFQRSGF